MAYQTALTIESVIKDIDSKKYLLPSIQREFVWSTKQIEKLFDSLMMDYPINAFLFWKVPKEKAKEFSFYEFLRDYHQRTGRHNPKANISGSDDIIAILDGQQRMTSLYIGLKGSYAYKISHKRWDNPQAYPARKLYLNVLGESEDSDLTYDFRFLTDSEVKSMNAQKDPNGNSAYFWYKVGDILDVKEEYEVNDILIDNNLNAHPNFKFANKALFKLFTVIRKNQTISYYLEESTELDKVLNIFIRVNSGGTTLSYSDLLLSFATAQWQQRDAREELNKFMDEVNMIGRGFNVGKDIILKACLVLSGFTDISFKVDNFNRSNMLVIEQNWDELTTAFRMAVELISSFGFSRENITSNNLIIPIAYYIKSIGNPSNFIASSNYAEDRRLLKKWFIASLLNRVFSFMPDGLLKPVRTIIDENPGSFPFDKIANYFRGTNRDIIFTDDIIDNLLQTKYGTGDILVVLSVLYPWADLKNNFHIDHIYPKSKFTPKKLEKNGIPADKIDFYIENVNFLGNLQLLEATPNEEKNNKDFDEWLKETFTSPDQLKAYKEKHYIPDVDLSFGNFEEFLMEREKLIVAALKKELM
ncbi:MAG: DUF262 domain-containing protein [Roseburia sp.]|uniref:GmrSD restriction endonuclease domain-containing protein n=1 Tax=Roseburia hominis TaxID=301301 RepID=UPI001F423023|nr:DUF262 domain-containing protein [Roseburia hominis]